MEVNLVAKIAADKVDNIGAKMAELAKLERKPALLGTGDAVRRISKSIRAMQAAGYTVAEIAEELTKAGLEVSTASLRGYLKTTPQDSAKVRRGKREKSAAADSNPPATAKAAKIDA
jgi:methyl coenzyme M reductase subunit C-like uncharacterized protein (methanogenesis marker protein 7)